MAEKSAIFSLLLVCYTNTKPTTEGIPMADDEKWGLSREEINERIEKQNQKHKKKGKGRSQNQKVKPYVLLQYLLKYTDKTILQPPLASWLTSFTVSGAL